MNSEADYKQAKNLETIESQCRFRSKMNSELAMIVGDKEVEDLSQCRFRSKMNSETTQH